MPGLFLHRITARRSIHEVTCTDSPGLEMELVSSRGREVPSLWLAGLLMYCLHLHGSLQRCNEITLEQADGPVTSQHPAEPAGLALVGLGTNGASGSRFCRSSVSLGLSAGTTPYFLRQVSEV